MFDLFFDSAGIRGRLVLVSSRMLLLSLILLMSLLGLTAHAQDGASEHRKLETESAEKLDVAKTEAAVGSVDKEALIAAVRAADSAYVRSARERDQTAFRDLLDEDVVFLADEARIGRLSVLTIWQPLFDGKYDFRYEGEHLEAHVADSGDLAWTIGTAITRFTRPGGGEKEVTESFYLNVWQPDADGKWLLKVISSLVVHPTLGSARDPRSGLMTAWPELADQIGAEIDLRWNPSATMRAASGELAYSFGEYEASFKSGEDSVVSGAGHFVATWRKDEKGAWQLAAEGFTPPGIYGGGE